MADVQFTASDVVESAAILTPEALDFVAGLHQTFGERRTGLLAERPARRQRIAEAGRDGARWRPDTRAIREDPTWKVAPVPPALRRRHVEITGPTERKMAINALNSGANVWLADLEDANTPHWDNVVSGQVNLKDAVEGTISFRSPEGREYTLRDGDRPVIVVRPRGWHLDERHIQVDGAPVAGALADFGLFFFHNAHLLAGPGRGPFFYLPKLESADEARLWADVFRHAEAARGIATGTVRATVLIETLPAAFEMEEILYELREYIAGLNAGRWDYLFSLIKVFRNSGAEYVLPDRNAVTMTAPFMRAYTELLVSTCHRRGAMAIGGMAAFIPSRRDEAVNATALTKVRDDKRREATDGFDGSWVAHPDLVPLCAAEFAAVLGDRDNQLDRQRDGVDVKPADLVTITDTTNTTEAGLRNDLAVALRYLATWLSGNGAVAIYNLMEDAATAEIARSQVWQWRRNNVVLSDGQPVTADLVRRCIAEEAASARAELAGSSAGHVDRAVAIVERLVLDDELADFLTVAASELI
ncbi:malate synthase A [Dactylosporangium sp. NPDC051541]|uniref:malate synthase A n=1 Tax=Dactylosporangium sp. NPDC051541 TaxID=3363977 RepID=UPI0037B39768